jgi:hypothetical protein
MLKKEEGNKVISENSYKLRVFGNRVLSRIFGPKRDEATGGWRNCILRSFITCTLCLV